MFRSLVLLIAGLAAAAHAYSHGAPVDVCNDLTPGHPAEPQTIASPYKITVSEVSIHSGDEVKITLEGKNNVTFKGFLLQARKGKDIVGKFLVPDNDPEVQTMDCPQGTKNAVTHRNADDKAKLEIIWKAPSDLQGKVVFLCTFVKEALEFWVAQTSAELTVVHQ